MSARYEFDFSELEKLEEKILRVPGNTEQIINGVLHKAGIKIAVDEITKRMPVSRRNKKHAKTSNWSKGDKDNLGFTVKAKGGAAKRPGSFGYLVFPNDGRGPYNHVAQNFFEDGLDDGSPKILDDLNIEIEKQIREDIS
ncbi:hypothetical protein [Alkalihalobacterium alkalinitrilicum]|uniref:hypothetical protein n=1 Tax=Alkalihalobacterium alkalinitrilicum TaxID=427920 RepID=UPI000995D164|nr:hypothetical protein [Alkalihalobacterium alkalinitrilicum]